MVAVVVAVVAVVVVAAESGRPLIGSSSGEEVDERGRDGARFLRVRRSSSPDGSKLDEALAEDAPTVGGMERISSSELASFSSSHLPITHSVRGTNHSASHTL